MNAPSKPALIGGPECPHWNRQWLPGPTQGISLKMPCAEPLCAEASQFATLYFAGRKFYRAAKYDPRRTAWEEVK